MKQFRRSGNGIGQSSAIRALPVHEDGIRQLLGINGIDCGALLLRSLFLFSAKITKTCNFRVKKLTRALELQCGMWYHNCAIQGNGKTRRYAHENDAF